MKLKNFITLAFIAFNFLFGQKGYYERLITDEGGVLKPGQPVIINGNSGTFMALNFQFKYIKLSGYDNVEGTQQIRLKKINTITNAYGNQISLDPLEYRDFFSENSEADSDENKTSLVGILGVAVTLGFILNVASGT